MKHRIAIVWIGLLVGATGCDALRMGYFVKDPVSVSPQPPVVVQRDAAELKNRFSDNEAQQKDAVQNAVMWSEKYQKLSETANDLREKNIRLMEENARLTKQFQSAQADLKQTRQELEDANSFLQKLHMELAQWKSDVLGFRDEIRRSQAAQLTALTKILRILGAEPVEAPKASTPPAPVKAP